MRTSKLVALVLALGPCATAVAATDGALATGGGDSEGTVDISLVKQVSIQITRMDDLAIGTFASLDEAVTVTDEVCVFTTGVDFLVGASSTSGAFELTGRDSGHRLPYTVSWGDETLATGEAADSILDTVPGILGAAAGGPVDTAFSSVQSVTDAACEGAGNASYSVTIAAEDFNAAPRDAYTDTLTLSVTPE